MKILQSPTTQAPDERRGNCKPRIELEMAHNNSRIPSLIFTGRQIVHVQRKKLPSRVPQERGRNCKANRHKHWFHSNMREVCTPFVGIPVSIEVLVLELYDQDSVS
jgi:hypothetical protein